MSLEPDDREAENEVENDNDLEPQSGISPELLPGFLTVQNNMISAMDAASLTLQRLRLIPRQLETAVDSMLFLSNLSAFSSSHPQLRRLSRAGVDFLHLYEMLLDQGYVFPPTELMRDFLESGDVEEDGSFHLFFQDVDIILSFSTQCELYVIRSDILSSPEEPSLYTPSAIFYFQDDELHRSSGLPAVFTPDGEYQEFWENGDFISAQGNMPDDFFYPGEAVDEDENELDDELDDQDDPDDDGGHYDESDEEDEAEDAYSPDEDDDFFLDERERPAAESRAAAKQPGHLARTKRG